MEEKDDIKEGNTKDAPIEPTINLPDWEKYPNEIRQKIIANFHKSFGQYVEQFLQESNRLIVISDKFSFRSKVWRLLLISFGGVLAAINVLISHDTENEFLCGYLPLTAALIAVLISVLTTVESLFRLDEKSRGVRDARELYLNAHNEFIMRWNTEVDTYGTTPTACKNALFLNKLIVEREKEIRQFVKGITKEKPNK